MTAQDILKCLARKHAKDVFVSECKDGPSQASNHVRMDAWVMNRSWVNACVTAYEIKVSRSDFLKDEKWQTYLPCCNKFYFVCPYKLIQPEEVPAQAGLLWVTAKATRAHTKRKAPYRDVEIPETLWRYILMCRARIGYEYMTGDGHRETYWREWLKKKKAKRELGYAVSRSMGEQYHEMERQVDRMKELVEGYDLVTQRLRELGFDPKRPVNEWNWEPVERKVKGQVTTKFRYCVEACQRATQDMLKELGEQEKGGEFSLEGTEEGV